ncbi:hypothetical protein PMIN01_00525, partial [Paraphaeosphaeria minitans]
RARKPVASVEDEASTQPPHSGSWYFINQIRLTVYRLEKGGDVDVDGACVAECTIAGVPPEGYHYKIATARASTCPYETCQAHSCAAREFLNT